ncbi:MAG: tetratricopeptide repeat protein [Gemmatimonadaceae bacterium]|nr:tetratricopeptide repeat protein [Gemmatimonadaceae bacterium]
MAQAEADLTLARALRTEAAEVAWRAGDRESEARALLGLGELARQQDDYSSAGSYYERSLALLRELGEPFHVSVALNNLAWVAIAAGRFGEALVLLAEAVQLGAAVGNQVSPAFGLATFAPLLHARGNVETAAVALAAAYQQLAAVGIKPPPADAHDWERVREKLRSALGEAAFERAWASGLTQSPSIVLARVLEMFGLTMAGDVAAPSASSPVESPPAAAPLFAQSVPAAPGPALRVLALGPLEIQCDGVTVPITAWRAARPRELLLFLLCHRAGRTRDQIALAFWPDAAPAQIKNNFHVALHYLRKAIGRAELVLFDRERYRVNWDLGVEFDVADFETAVRDALRQPPSELPAAALRDALARYRGDFLEDAGAGDWHLELRDHLRRLYVDGLLALGTHEEAASRFAEAAELNRRILTVDPLDEEASRRLMRCHARLGERAEALREFERLARVLRSEFDAEPDPATRALAERLKRAEPV